MKISIISIPVRNQERSIRFFLDILGFRLVVDRPIPGSQNRWVQLAPPTGEVSICLVTWYTSMSPGSQRGFIFETRHLDEDAIMLKERGLLFEPIQEAPWARFITFSDPDGNSFILQEVKRDDRISKRLTRYLPGQGSSVSE